MFKADVRVAFVRWRWFKCQSYIILTAIENEFCFSFDSHLPKIMELLFSASQTCQLIVDDLKWILVKTYMWEIDHESSCI